MMEPRLDSHSKNQLDAFRRLATIHQRDAQAHTDTQPIDLVEPLPRLAKNRTLQCGCVEPDRDHFDANRV